MKRLFFLLFAFLPLMGIAQKISLQDLLKIQNYSLSEINDFLIERAWNLTNSFHDEDMNSKNFDGKIWTTDTGTWEYITNGILYGKIEYKNFIEFYDPKDILKSDETKLIIFITPDLNKYLSIKESLATLGFTKFKENFISSTVIQVSYKNKTHVVRLSNYTTENKNTLYVVHVQNLKKNSEN